MTPAPSEPSELQNRLRQQLILAQVRIMDLEDVRDTLAPKVAEFEQLLAAAQTLADRKLDEAAHLEKVLADSRAQVENLQVQLQKIAADLAGSRLHLTQAESDLLRVQHEASAQSTRRAQLEATLAAMKSTRSWKWTAWLRSLGRIFSGKQA